MFLASITSFSHLRSVFPDRVIQFGETLGDQVKGRSPKKLKSLIEVPSVVHVKVHILSFNMFLISTRSRVLTPSYPVRSIFGQYAKGSKRLKILIAVP